MANWARGLLSGIASGADAYSEVITEQSKRKYEDLKANTLFDRQKSLESLRNTRKVEAADTAYGRQQDVALQGRGWEVEDLAAAKTQAALDKKEGREYTEGATDRALQQKIDRGIAATLKGTETPEEKQEIIERITQDVRASEFAGKSLMGEVTPAEIEANIALIKDGTEMDVLEKRADELKMTVPELLNLQGLQMAMDRRKAKTGGLDIGGAESKVVADRQAKALKAVDDEMSTMKTAKERAEYAAKLPAGPLRDRALANADRDDIQPIVETKDAATGALLPSGSQRLSDIQGLGKQGAGLLHSTY